jgi:uncharacterized membrane protein
MPDDTDGADGKPAAPSASRLSYLGRASHLGYLSRLSSYGGRDRMMARAGQMEYDRILFFSDAVFAIAITLLVIDLPGQIERASGSTGQSGALQAGTELRNAGSGIEGFAISFAVIGVFWMAHHSFYQHVKAIDRPLMILNLLFLGTIAFLPYPTDLLSSVSSNQRPAVIFYAVCVGSAGLVETVAWLYATQASAGLVKGISPDTRRLFALGFARIPVIFGLSIAVAQVSPRLAEYFWLTAWLAGIVINRRYGHHDLAQPEDPGDSADPADE